MLKENFAVIGVMFLMNAFYSTNKISSNSTLTLEIRQSADSIKLESFTKAPDDIEGCGSAFSVSQKTLDKMSYLFMSSYEGIAYIKIGGKFIRLKIVSTNRNKESFFGNTIKEVYQGGGFKVTVDAKYLNKDEGEVSIYKGYIQVEREKKDKTKVNVIGETGC